MGPEAFKRDPLLRSSGYDLASWALVNAAFSIPAYYHCAGRHWRGDLLGLYSLTLIACGIGAALFNRRRVEKMLGGIADEAVFRAEFMWAPMLVTAFTVTALLVASAREQFIQPLWMLTVGTAYLAWGLKAGVATFRPFGALLVAAALVAASLQQPQAGAPPSAVGLHMWNLLMGVGALVTSVATNRRYLWCDAGASTRQ